MEGQVDTDLHVRTTVGTPAAATATKTTAAAKGTENIAKDILKTAKTTAKAATAAAKAGIGINSGMTILIITGFFIGIA